MKKILAVICSIILLALQITPFGLYESAKADDVVVEDEYYVQTFIISAYYSPVPGQEHYATGTYDGDIYLNGSGVNGADGTPVYPGMIAAPKKYAFGTKMNIPGIGIVAVHDRGGAIVEAGQRGHEYDRLDVWMGYGDIGLQRALSWGKRTVDVIVYGLNPAVEESVYLEGYSAAESLLQTTILSPLEFPKDIYFGSEGEEVKKMQTYLIEWGYYDSEASGFYGSDTAQAIFEFQMDFGIVSGPDELGSGHFGINTRRKFDELISDNTMSADLIKLKKGENLMSKYTDLQEEKDYFAAAISLGDSGSTVLALQKELVRLGFLRIEPNGYFGETTEHAVYKFQQSQGIVVDENDSGAGYVGPATRSALNLRIEDRFEMKSMLAYQREEVKQGRHLVAIPEETIAVIPNRES